MSTSRTRLLWLFLPLALVLVVSAPSAKKTETQSGTLRFEMLDGSSEDLDGVADGVWTVPGGMILEGKLVCGEANGNEAVASQCAMALRVEGDLELRSGGAIAAADGLELDIDGDLRVGAGSVIVSEHGAVEIAARGRIEVDGLLSAGGDSSPGAGSKSRTHLELSRSMRLRSTGGSGFGIRLGASGTVLSTAAAHAGGLIELSGCGLEIHGLVASIGQGPGAGIVLRSCEGLVVDGRDLADPAGLRRGRLEARGSRAARIDLFAQDSVVLDGAELGVAGGAGGDISVTADRGSLSWERGKGAAGPAGAIRLSACADIDLDGSRLAPAPEIVEACAGVEKVTPDSGLVALPTEFSGSGLGETPGPQASGGVCTPNLAVDNMTISTFAEFISCNVLTSSNTRIIPRGRVTFKALTAIELGDGFSVEGSSHFTAVIDPTLNQPPTILSDGGGPTATVSVPENTTAVTDVDASDPEGDTESGGGLVYSLSGDDATKFSIDAAGLLTFVTAPDFDHPGDADSDNDYEVTVTVTDSVGLTDAQAITVSVTDVNELPTITSSAMFTIPENQTAVATLTATDPDVPAQTLTWMETGGADAALLSISASGMLSFDSAPDFETPLDVAGAAAGDNVYEIDVQVDDGAGGMATQSLSITVTDLNEEPVITSSAMQTVAENETVVATLTATDPDMPAQTLTWTETGGADAAKLSITAGGMLTFDTAPDFENPGDADVDNKYEVTVTVTDSFGLTDTQDITVTVTDVLDTGTIEIVKATLPAGGTGFGFTGDIGMANVFSLNDGQTQTFTLVVPGTYTVIEDDPTPAFDLSLLDCVDPDGGSMTNPGTREATIDLDPGETVTCTFTNTQRGSIVIVKDSLPNGPTDFGFTSTGGLSPAVFDLDDDSDVALSNTQTLTDVVPGTYTVTEDDPTPGFDLTGLACVDPDTGSSTILASREATIDLDPGETVTCTFTNTQRGSIVIVKDSLPNGPTDFGFTSTGGLSPAVFDLDDDSDVALSNTQTLTDVVPGTYTVTEDDPTPGFDLTGLACVDPDTGSSTILASREATIDLDPGETVTCTFTNTQRGSIVIVKDSLPNGPTDFGFTSTGGLSPAVFDLDDDSDVALSNTQTLTDVVPGTYTVTEDDPTPGFDLTGLACVDPDTGSSTILASREATIDLDPGETVTCTFTNTQRGSIVIVKDSLPNGPTDFGFTSTGGLSPAVFDLDDDSDVALSNTQTLTDVVPGTYTVTEDDPTPGFDLTALACVDPDTGSSTSLVMRKATIDLDPGETVTCTFTNTQRGSVTIVKDTIPNDPQSFGFTGSFGPFSLVDNGGVNSATFNNLPAANGYEVTESDPSPAVLTDITCNDGGSANPSTDSGATATINVDPGEAVTCTFTNSFNMAPTGAADSFEFVGNTLLLVDKTTSGRPEILVSTTGGTTPAADGVLDNDTDPDMDALSVSGIFANMTPCADMTPPFTDCPTFNGGKVTMESNGQFSYTPKAGDTLATDMFGYKLFDGIDTDDVVVTLTRKNRVWYVENDHTPNADPNDNGTSTDPFPLLSDAGTNSLAGDTIFVFEGSGMTTGQNAGIALKTMQRLLGEAVALTVPEALNGGTAPTTLFAAGNKPLVEHATAMMDGITVDATAGDQLFIEIRGLSISGARNAIDVTSALAFKVGVAITDNFFGDSGDEAIDLNPGGPGDFVAIIENNTFSTSSPTGNAIDVTTGAGAGDVEVAINNNTDITSSGGDGIHIDGTLGTGTLYIFGFADNTVNGATGGTGIRILGATFDSDSSDPDFDLVDAGTTTVGSGGDPVGGAGVILGTTASRVSGNLSFGQLDVSNSAGTGLAAVGTAVSSGGTPPTAGFRLAVTTGTISATGGPGLVADSATTDGVTFTTVSSTSSSSTGIELDSISGTLTMNGGSITSAAGTAYDVGGNANGSGGNATVSYSGNITNTSGRAVLIEELGGGSHTLSGTISHSGSNIGIQVSELNNGTSATVTFSGGSKAINSGSTNAVNLVTNPNGRIDFTGGGLDLDVSSGIGLNATGGGTINVTGSGNTIAVSGTGQAVVMNGVDLGASDVTFDSITSIGIGGSAPTADVLSFTNVSNLGIFEGGVVDIDDTAGAADGIDISGGSADFDFTSATIAGASNAIKIGGGATGNIVFDTVDIDAPAGVGIAIDGYTGGDFDNVTVSGGTIDDSAFEAISISNNGISGSVFISGLLIDDAGGHGVFLQDNNATVNILTTTIGETTNSATTTGGNALSIVGGASPVNVSGSIVNTALRAVEVVNRTGGLVAIGSAISETGTGIRLNSNTGGTINFSGGMTLDTGANTAFSATGGGSINVTGTNTIGASGAISGPAVDITDVAIAAGNVTFQSIDFDDNGGSAVAINLDDTGTGTFNVTGTGADGTGGTLEDTLADAVRLNNTDGKVTLEDMIIQDIGLMTGGLDTPSGHDAIHGERVDGGLRLDNVTIRRISDSAINGSTLAGGALTTFVGLEIIDSTLEDTNRYHEPAGCSPVPCGDDSTESIVVVQGISGTVTVTGSTFQRGAAGLDFRTAASGTLTMTVQNNMFADTFKGINFAAGAQGRECILVDVDGSTNANIHIGDPLEANAALGNSFDDCALDAIRVAHRNETATGAIDLIVSRNTFSGSGFEDDFGLGNFPNSSILAHARGTSVATMDGIISFNTFTQVGNAGSGLLGNINLRLGDDGGTNNGTSQFRVSDNTMTTPLEQFIHVFASENTAARVLLDDNTLTGGTVLFPDADDGASFPTQVPFNPFTVLVTVNGKLDLTIRDHDFPDHDNVNSFTNPENFFVRMAGGGTALDDLCLSMTDNTTEFGYQLRRDAGAMPAGPFTLYKGASAVPGGSTCTSADPETGNCRTVLDDNNNTGAGGTTTTSPPQVDVDGTITIGATACDVPSGLIDGGSF